MLARGNSMCKSHEARKMFSTLKHWDDSGAESQGKVAAEVSRSKRDVKSVGENNTGVWYT